MLVLDSGLRESETVLPFILTVFTVSPWGHTSYTSFSGIVLLSLIFSSSVA